VADLSMQQIEALWIKAGGSKSMAPLMAAIAMAESSGNPSVVNSIGAAGLWQIYDHPDLVAKYGSMTSPLNNARAAVAVYQEQGLDAWDTYKSGAYKQFLPHAKSVFSQVEGGLGDILNGILGGAESANPLNGLSLSLPSDITGAFTAAEKIFHGLMWIVHPTNWARIFAGAAGMVLMVVGLIALGMAA
jgi:Lysozyme like domain